jgi:hypothetical protein
MGGIALALLCAFALAFGFAACHLDDDGDSGKNVYRNDFDHPVYVHDGLKDALDWLSGNAVSGNTYLIVLVTDESAFAPYTLAFSGKNNVGVSLLSGSESALTVQLSGAGSLFTVSGSTTLTVGENIRLSGISGNTDSLVRVNAAGTLEAEGNAKITGNTNSYGNGGGVSVAGGTFTMSGSASVSGNSAGFGGGVYVSGGTFTMNGGSVSGNTASGNGGGVCVNGGTFTMNGGGVSGNTASNSGGGVYVYGGTFIMNGGASVSGNTATISGGGVYVASSGAFTMNGGASVSGNSAASTYSWGGGVCVGSGTFTLNGGASVWGNTATYSGGGVYVAGGAFTMNGGRIQGGADSEGFTKNTASNGAALYANEGTTAKFGAGSTNCAVGSTSMAAGDDIVSEGSGTDETIVATAGL